MAAILLGTFPDCYFWYHSFQSIPHSGRQGAASHHFQAHSAKILVHPLPPPVLFLPSLSNSCRHNYTRLRSTCASAACLEQWIPGRQSVQWEEEMRGRKGCEAGIEIFLFLFLKKEKNSPLYFQGGRKSCNYNIGGFGLQVASSVC